MIRSDHVMPYTPESYYKDITDKSDKSDSVSTDSRPPQFFLLPGKDLVEGSHMVSSPDLAPIFLYAPGRPLDSKIQTKSLHDTVYALKIPIT